MNCFRTWEDWAIYPNEFLIRLQNVFLGLVTSKMDEPEVMDLDGEPERMTFGRMQGQMSQETGDLDGLPLHDEKEDLDGLPLPDEDLDGMPMDERPKYAPSKWETVDPEMIEAQAMTTSKWDLLDQQDDGGGREDDIDGKPMDDSPDDGSYEKVKTNLDEERRAKLREIELKVMKFQDELESGKRGKKTGMSISEQVEQHRQKLLRKEREREEKERDQELRRDPSSPDDSNSHDRRSRLSGSPSPRRPRSRSRSPRTPARRSRSRSPRRSQKEYSPRRKSHRSRSRSPRRTGRRSRSRSPVQSHRRKSPSRSPSRKSHKKKSKH